jgi:ABC-type lipoprotein export system ATPase subunit
MLEKNDTIRDYILNKTTESSEKPFIECLNLVKKYKLGGETIAALDGISLTINRGDFIAITGPSGSGKSTLANVIGVWINQTLAE